MENDQCIYLLKGKINYKISSLSFNKETRLYEILFDNGKQYTYNAYHVIKLKLVKDNNCAVTAIEYETGKAFHANHYSEYKEGGTTVFRFYYNVGDTEQFIDKFANEVKLELGISDKKSSTVLDYLREIATHCKLPSDEGTDISLGQKYDRLRLVYENSIMAAYLCPEKYKLHSRFYGLLIFPFGCNSSQYKAVTDALENNLSIIQGPPGTGKTQTILNIMANLLVCRRTMQIVSNNNSAVENIKEKLAQPKYGFDFLVAQLGKKLNKEAFISNQNGEYPDLESWYLSKERQDTIYKTLPKIQSELRQLYEKEERLAKVEQNLLEYEVQKSHLGVSDNLSLSKKLSTDSALSLICRCTNDYEKKGRLKLLTRLSLWSKKIRRQPDVVKYLQAAYFCLMIEKLQHEKKALKYALKSVGSLQTQQELLSLEYLKGCLFERFSHAKERRIFSEKELIKSPDAFLKEYPIVLSTTFSASSNIGSQTRFDYLIMDEASQVDVAAGALALNCASSAVIVGDLKQLPNVITDDQRMIMDSILAKYNISPAYQFTENSFLSSVCHLFPNVPNTLLKEHYRCHPLIIGFCNKQFYNGQLVPMKNGTDTDNALILAMTQAGILAHGSSNLRQAEIISQELVPKLINSGYKDIGVIAPYNNQVNLVREKLKETGEEIIPVATVHKFQGRENDAIILSTVDNEPSDFVNDPHLLNVAVSRAKEKFVLVVTGNEQKDSNIKSLIDYIRYYEGEEFQTSVNSVFDLLYEPLKVKRMAFLKEHNRISEYDSENLMYGLLEDSINNTATKHLKILCHYPLRLLIGKAQLTDEESLYASRQGTHLDFLIYNTVTRMPVFAVEVDGYSYHNSKTKQASRDMLKNSIMSKLGIPLERFSTIGSGEKERINSILYNLHNV